VTRSTITSEDRPTATSHAPLVRALRVLVVLTFLNVLLQFVTAGQLFPQGGPEGLHAAGAITLHVVSGLAALAAVLLWRRGGATVALPALSIVVFLGTLVQAAIGGRSTLWIHVPGAMVLTSGVVWLLVRVLRPDTRT
jgi:hypothetical protein